MSASGAVGTSQAAGGTGRVGAVVTVGVDSGVGGVGSLGTVGSGGALRLLVGLVGVESLLDLVDDGRHGGWFRDWGIKKRLLSCLDRKRVLVVVCCEGGCGLGILVCDDERRENRVRVGG